MRKQTNAVAGDNDNDNNKVISFKANEKYIKLVDNLSKIVNILIEKY